MRPTHFIASLVAVDDAPAGVPIVVLVVGVVHSTLYPPYPLPLACTMHITYAFSVTTAQSRDGHRRAFLARVSLVLSPRNMRPTCARGPRNVSQSILAHYKSQNWPINGADERCSPGHRRRRDPGRQAVCQSTRVKLERAPSPKGAKSHVLKCPTRCARPIGVAMSFETAEATRVNVSS